MVGPPSSWFATLGGCELRGSPIELDTLFDVNEPSPAFNPTTQVRSTAITAARETVSR
jgi:hypothetical protein